MTQMEIPVHQFPSYCTRYLSPIREGAIYCVRGYVYKSISWVSPSQVLTEMVDGDLRMSDLSWLSLF